MKRKNFVIIFSALFIVVAVLGLGLLFFVKFRQSIYPSAPPMPPIVSQTTEEILSRLEVVLKNKAPQILTNLQPGLSAEKINELEHQSGVQLPDEIKVLYRWRNGFNLKTINSGGFRIAGPMPGHYFCHWKKLFRFHI